MLAYYLKLPEYFLPSTLGPVALDLISARLPSFTSVGLVYDFTKYLHPCKDGANRATPDSGAGGSNRHPPNR